MCDPLSCAVVYVWRCQPSLLYLCMVIPTFSWCSTCMHSHFFIYFTLFGCYNFYFEFFGVIWIKREVGCVILLI